MATANKTVFDRDTLNVLFGEFETAYAGTSEYDQLLRETHLAIALFDAGRDLEGQVDERVAALVRKHRPAE